MALSAEPVINAQTGNNREQRLAGQNAVATAAQDELLARAKVGNVTAQDLPFAQQVLAALKQNQQVNAFAASKGSNLSFAGEQSFTALLVQATHAVELASAAAAAADAGARSVGLASRTVNVNLNVGGRSYQVNGTQSNVDGLLAALEQARLASGGG